jgi:hypothetical protein
MPLEAKAWNSPSRITRRLSIIGRIFRAQEKGINGPRLNLRLYSTRQCSLSLKKHNSMKHRHDRV